MASQIRQKKSTVASTIATIKAVTTVIEPTLALDALEQEHFDRIMQSRETETWSPHDISIACQLAKTMKRQSEIAEFLDREGLTLDNPRGTRVAHPLLSASMTIASTIQALTRTLGLGASQRGVSGGVQGSRNLAEQQARKVISKASQDDLL